MENKKHITSLQNPLVKKVLLLQEKSRERRNSGLFVLEGGRELQLALQSGYEIVTVFFYAELIAEKEVTGRLKKGKSHPEIIEVSKPVYQKLAYRDTTGGLLAIVKSGSHSLNNLRLKNKNPLILVAEAPEKPGNIGALLRTADAAKLDAIIIANPKTDLYNPNIIRSSVGCIFTGNVATGSSADVITFLKEKKIPIHCAALSASKSYLQSDFTLPTAIVVGTEAEGLTDEWLQSSDQNIIIPMEGQIDSMNVSVSAAILIFEAKRQRTVSSEQ
ncbi:RNA methyltransferase [Flavobacteriaceae bacterium F89]|uniref:RNA methyltransferase n=1 Tax=Cerina litoralis TaxID=2874477 RepID=A0AAE3EW25_9FLAO|nr:RNA methyltransferase [Cerina litoralis]MCG2462117.1 RNA methyltransferase [Cerina litoralis]